MPKKWLAAAVVLGALVFSSTTYVLAQGGSGETPVPEDIASVEPMPSAVVFDGATELMPEWTTRLEDWSARFAVRDMSVEELVASMDTLTRALASLEETDDEWLRQRELMMRRLELCELLPTDHSYRGGEYCL